MIFLPNHDSIVSRQVLTRTIFLRFIDLPLSLCVSLSHSPSQVNGWGFKRITEGADLNAYYHESFLRGLPELCAEMRRPAKGEHKGIKNKKSSTEGGGGGDPPPNFDRISMIAPLPTPSSSSSRSKLCKKTSPSGETSTPRLTLSPRSQRPAMTTEFSLIDSERPTMRDGGVYRYVEAADDDDDDDDDNVLKAPGSHYQHQQWNHSCDSATRRGPPMTPTPRDSNEISPAQEAFLSYTPMADVASVSSDFDNEGDHWGESPFNTTFIASGATTASSTGAAAAASEQCKPLAIPSSSAEFLSVPSEVKIMSTGESLRASPCHNKDFLTKADLTYLEHQNKLLLEQSGMFIHRREHQQQHRHASSYPDPFAEEGPLDDDDDDGDDDDEEEHHAHYCQQPQQPQPHQSHRPDQGPEEEYNNSSSA
jgi:hypothetical protein